MARGTGRIDVGIKPPQILWTIVRGDTASFTVYVTDDVKTPLILEDWSIIMEIKRPIDPKNAGIITDAANTIFTLYPIHEPSDPVGEFTVSLTAAKSALLETGDIFDIEISTVNKGLVWTVAQGSLNVIEDVTN